MSEPRKRLIILIESSRQLAELAGCCTQGMLLPFPVLNVVRQNIASIAGCNIKQLKAFQLHLHVHYCT